MHRHQAHGVLGFIHLQRNHASSLAEVCEIVDKFFQIRRLVDFFLFPFCPEVKGRLQNGGRRVELELTDDDFERRRVLLDRACRISSRAA